MFEDRLLSEKIIHQDYTSVCFSKSLRQGDTDFPASLGARHASLVMSWLETQGAPTSPSVGPGSAARARPPGMRGSRGHSLSN